MLWLTWLTVENNFDLFKTFNEWGVKGLKIDFMDRSDQWMVNYYERVAREAAKHHCLSIFMALSNLPDWNINIRMCCLTKECVAWNKWAVVIRIIVCIYHYA